MIITCDCLHKLYFYRLNADTNIYGDDEIFYWCGKCMSDLECRNFDANCKVYLIK